MSRRLASRSGSSSGPSSGTSSWDTPTSGSGGGAGGGGTAIGVGGAGTGTFQTEAASGIYNELQAGSYVFMDSDYALNPGADREPAGQFQHALFVQTSVMSMPAPERVVLDAGHKTCAIDSGPPQPFGLPGAVIGSLSDEHTVLDVTEVNEFFLDSVYRPSPLDYQPNQQILTMTIAPGKSQI